MVRDGWLNLVLALSELVPLLFKGSSFRHLDSVVVGGACKLRRVFTLREVADEVDASAGGGGLLLPRGLEFPAGLAVRTQLLGAAPLPPPRRGRPAAGRGAASSSSRAGGAASRKPGGLVVKVRDGGDSSDEDAAAVPAAAAGTRAGSLAAMSRPISLAGAVASPKGPGSPWAVRSGAAAAASVSSPTTRGHPADPQQHQHLSRMNPRPSGAAAASRPAAPPQGAALPQGNGRRAISAQTTLREEDGAAPISLPLLRGAAAAAGAPSSAAASGSATARNAPAPALSGLPPGSYKPMSPPFPRATYSQRAQSGPARMEDGLTAPMPIPQPPQPAGGGVAADPALSPDTPTSSAAARHGRRSVLAMAAAGRNIPSTIAEAGEPLRSSSEDTAVTSAAPNSNGSATRASLAVHRMNNGKAGAGGGSLLGSSPQGKEPPQHPRNGGGALASRNNDLGSLLQVNSSLDFSAAIASGLSNNHRGDLSASHATSQQPSGSGTQQQQPLVSNMFSVMQSLSFPVNTKSNDRYGGSYAAAAAAALPASDGKVAGASSALLESSSSSGSSGPVRPQAPPTNQRPAAPADHASRPRMPSPAAAVPQPGGGGNRRQPPSPSRVAAGSGARALSPGRPVALAPLPGAPLAPSPAKSSQPRQSPRPPAPHGAAAMAGPQAPVPPRAPPARGAASPARQPQGAPGRTSPNLQQRKLHEPAPSSHPAAPSKAAAG